ncbi:MAG: hypothetical protein WCG34_05000 [Leptolinea sp.]
MNKNVRVRILGVSCILITTLACNLPFKVVPNSPEPGKPVTNLPTDISPSLPTQQPPTIQLPTETPTPSQTPQPPTATFTATAIPHVLKPADVPPGRISWMWDRDSSTSASQHQPGGGDDYSKNLYERPFSANTQERYYPDIDIQESALSFDTTWIYVAITVKSPDPQSNTLDGQYGVEIDLNQDGRGDVLITAEQPGTDWSTDRVKAFKDTNLNVGNKYPIKSDPPQTGDGYETLVFDQGIGQDADIAWARRSTSNASVVWIAFKKALINSDMQFMWGAWAERMVKNPVWMDYNDHFTYDEAGSPLPGLPKYYPMKALAELDNTCRWTVGFQGTGQEPGICFIASPTPVPPTEVPPTEVPPFVKPPFKIPHIKVVTFVPPVIK